MSNNTPSPEIRKGLIRNLMFQLYSDARTIYREYVQNALDSINNAVKLGILSQAKDGNVQIEINVSQRTVIIKDNGTGIPSNIAVKTLLDISAQNKDGINQAGQFGIGRLVGGGYCHKLIFRTSTQNESQATRVIFNVDKIWHMLNDNTEDYLATDVIRQCTVCDNYVVSNQDHFFEVELSGIKEEREELLSKEAIEEYLNEVAPVEYKPEFKNTLIYKSLQNNPTFMNLFDQMEKVQIFLGEKRIQKQYGLEIDGTGDRINNLEFFEIKTQDSALLAWGWFALTKFTIQIPRTNHLAGIRLRKHNIQIGDSNLLSDVRLWKESRGNSYFYGEVFITHPKIEPNTARDGLAPSPETNIFYEKIKEYFSELKNMYTRANQAKKSIERIYDGIKRIKENGSEDFKSKDLIENKGIASFCKLKDSTKFEPAIRMLNLYEEEYLKAIEEVKVLRAQLNRKAIENKNKIQEEDKDKDSQANERAEINTQIGTCSGVISDTDNINGNVIITEEVGMPTSEESSKNRPPHNKHLIDVEKEDAQAPSTVTSSLTSINTTKETINIDGLIAPLKIRGNWDENEIWIIKRALAVLYRNFPAEERDRILVKKMMELIVEEFSK